MAEMQKITTKLCTSCIYSAITNQGTVICDYYLTTLKRRGCKWDECDKHEARNGKRKRKGMGNFGKGRIQQTSNGYQDILSEGDDFTEFGSDVFMV